MEISPIDARSLCVLERSKRIVTFLFLTFANCCLLNNTQDSVNQAVFFLSVPQNAVASVTLGPCLSWPGGGTSPHLTPHLALSRFQKSHGFTCLFCPLKVYILYHLNVGCVSRRHPEL